MCPHTQMIAGNYLGEIFRQVIVEMVDEGVLFLGQVRIQTRSSALCLISYVERLQD